MCCTDMNSVSDNGTVSWGYTPNIKLMTSVVSEEEKIDENTCLLQKEGGKSSTSRPSSLRKG